MKAVSQVTLADAAKLIKDGDTIALGGFGMTGTPVHLLDALAECDVRDLTIISNNLSEPGLGACKLLRNGQLRKTIGERGGVRQAQGSRQVAPAIFHGAPRRLELDTDGTPASGCGRSSGQIIFCNLPRQVKLDIIDNLHFS